MLITSLIFVYLKKNGRRTCTDLIKENCLFFDRSRILSTFQLPKSSVPFHLFVMSVFFSLHKKRKKLF